MKWPVASLRRRSTCFHARDGMSRAAGDIRQITGIGQLERVKFFSKDWQPIEERDFVFDTTSPLYTSVYGLGYVDDLVERNQYYDTLSGAAMNDRLWVQQDQNHDVTSIANDSQRKGATTQYRSIPNCRRHLLSPPGRGAKKRGHHSFLKHKQ